jgi:ribosomal protein S18 acetylase RimI-like enzyme
MDIEADPMLDCEGLDGLLSEAWAEAGRRGPMPEGWRPFDPGRVEGIALYDDADLLGYAAVRPAEGMDSLDLLYLRRGARKTSAVAALLESAIERLKEIGQTRIVYAGYGWWRDTFPTGLAKGFTAAGFTRFEGVFLQCPIEGRPHPEPTAVREGYAVEPWRDEWFEPVCDLMLICPEPEAIYWDMGLCRRSIVNAATPGRPMFPDGLGQVALHDGKVVAFTLATTYGYVNHVYTHPDHRGRGLGAAMVSRLLAALARRGVQRATILTHETNPTAIALYERMGFEVDFRYPQFWTKW